MKWRNIKAPWVILTLTIALLTIITPIIFAEPINDGSFENIPSDWEEFFSTPCPLSGIGDWSDIDEEAPQNIDGEQTLWVGGACGPSPLIIRNNGARQSIPLAENAALLSFWFYPLKRDPGPPNIDRAVVTIDDEEIWSLIVDGINNPTGWNNAIIDITEFADQTVSLSLAMQQNIDGSIANVFFDAIEVFHPDTTISQAISSTAVLEGEPFTVEITIENSGDTVLENIAVTNTDFADCDQTAGSLPALEPGESLNYSCDVDSAIANQTNTATVQATTTTIEYLVEANHTIDVAIVNPLLTLTVTPDQASIREGEQLFFTITLTNNGSASLDEVTINSEPDTGCDLFLDTLAVGQTAVFNCTYIPRVSGTILFTATGLETVTNSEVATATAVSIELLPIDPPTSPGSNIYLPLMLNNYLSQNALGEPNDACSQAYPIETNQAYKFLAENTHDWYQFSLNGQTDVTIKLTEFVPIAGQITVWRGSCGNLTLLGQNGDFSATKTISLSNQPTGIYYVWLINDGGVNLSDQYSLNITTP
ncbi:hypothetical protein [Candidatus Leptofilum sp.]|uniref:hypothetical protein n=1 Tax=Candidatus Leptofilum sp. TaxID=3241576 RepID=UPI003B5CA31B